MYCRIAHTDVILLNVNLSEVNSVYTAWLVIIGP